MAWPSRLVSAMLGAPFRKLGRFWAGRRIAKIERGRPESVLTSLLNKARNTKLGKQFGFGEILAAREPYEAFRNRLPVIDYPAWVDWLGEEGPLGPEGARPLVDLAWPGTVDVFCLSSGTTSGRTKFIPYSREMAAVNRVAALDFFAHIVRTEPSLAPPLTKSLYMSGSTRIQRNRHGALCGDMSGLTKFLTPFYLDLLTLPSRAVSGLEPWEKRLEAMVALCTPSSRIGMLSGIPIWQLTLLEAVQKNAGKPLREVLPHLRVLVHGGMSMVPYRDRLRALLGDGVHFLEVYAASETGISAFQVPGETGMRFCEQYGVFYEFEDESGNLLLSHELVPGKPYALVVSSCAGLWRYRIGDIAVFRQRNPLVLDYVARDKTTSAFDEKITEKELERAMSAADPSFSDFAMGPDTHGRRHAWFLIAAETPPMGWLEDLDRTLRANNQDYDDYRGDGRISAPVSYCIPDRARFLEILGREEGGQRKFPRILAAAEVDRLLQHFGKNPEKGGS